MMLKSRHSEAFVAKLSEAMATPARLDELARAWSAAEGFAHLEWGESEVKSALADIAALAARAVAEGKDLYQWTVV
jgi:hypothetical protein